MPVVSRIVHFTGYELNVDQIGSRTERQRGRPPAGPRISWRSSPTAAISRSAATGCTRVRARRRRHRRRPEASALSLGQDLLGKTLSFYQSSARLRLEKNFNRVYRYYEAFFERGQSPYIRFIRKNLTFLNTVIQNGDWNRLRRHPPCIIPDPQGEAHLIELALQRVRDWTARNPPTRSHRPLTAARQPRFSVLEDDGEAPHVERDLDENLGLACPPANLSRARRHPVIQYSGASTAFIHPAASRESFCSYSSRSNGARGHAVFGRTRTLHEPSARARSLIVIRFL